MVLRTRLQTFCILLLGTISVCLSEVVNDLNQEINSYSESCGRAVGPLEIEHAVVIPAPDLEPYARKQIVLEDIANDSNLYQVSESDRQKILLKLYSNTTVQKILKECNAFHIEVNCKNNLYRTADGTCNNLKHPKWGSYNTAQDSLTPQFYEGAREFRKSLRGKELPNPRSISLNLKNNNIPSKHVSSLFTFFGQLIAHDATLLPSSTVNGDVPTCCNPTMRNHPSCHPIILPKDDSFYSIINVTCHEFIRSTPYPQCNFDQRRIVNRITSFLDASMVYGNDAARSQLLRTTDGSGKLIVQNSIFGQLLPGNFDKEPFCLIKKPDLCFRGGDERLNQNTMLTLMHTIFVRYHNFVADQLHVLNPSWDGNKIYQEGRRIVGAVFQYIVYNEYLPLLIGQNNMIKYDLGVKKESYYDDTINPAVLTEFSTSAFRLHSMIPQKISKYNDLEMKSSFSQTLPLFHGESASLLAGSAELPSETFDPFLIDDIKSVLYMPPGATYGLDLAALNINRGRDLGLSPYIGIVKVCSEETLNVQSFNDLTQLMNEENIELLKSMYEDVGDVDLFVGLLMERQVEDAEVGNTTACILSKQFHRLKFGDSFFFTHVNGRYTFTNDQLKAIESSSMAHIICITSNLPFTRKNPLEIPHANNPIMPCSEIAPMDFLPWKE